MLVRGPSLAASMSYYLVEQIEATPRSRSAPAPGGRGARRPTTSTARPCCDAGTGECETGRRPSGCSSSSAPSRAPTGWTPRAPRRARVRVAGPDLLVDGERPPGWPLDRDPYHLETSVPGVFVAGDVRAESVKRVASAVGEGAMAVMLVHRYLERL